MSEIRIYLFGPPRIERNNENIEINRRKAAALLAYLEVNAQPYARDSLATLLWPDHDQAGARGSLRRELSRFKKMLHEPILSIDRETVGLNEQANVWLDIREFQTRLASVQTHHHTNQIICSSCAEFLKQAIALYRDDFMAGFSLPDSPVRHPKEVAKTEGALAALYHETGRNQQAFQHYEQAIEYLQRIGEENELATLLLSKAQSHYELNEFDNAAALAREGLQLAQKNQQHLTFQQARILLALIEKALNDSSKLSQDLYTRLEECETDVVRAAIHYAIWRIEGDLEQAQQALTLYQSLAERSPAVLYLKRLGELQIPPLEKTQL